jgi:hypothetical protein
MMSNLDAGIIWAETCRKIAGSFAAVSKKTGIPTNAFFHWNRGNKLPRLSSIARIMAAYPEYEDEWITAIVAMLMIIRRDYGRENSDPGSSDD